MSDFNLFDVLEETTVMRSERTIESDSADVLTAPSSLEFEDEPEDFELDSIEEEKIEILTPYDAETNAEILVELLDTVNTQACTPLARWKLQKKQGGKAVIHSMQDLFEKDVAGIELTPAEKQKLAKYNSYLRDKEELEKAIPYSADEKEALKRSAIPMLKESKLEIGGAGAFWTQLAMIQGSRILSILVS